MPQTPTHTDSLAQHKALRNEIAGLVREKESLKREVEQYAQAKTALIEELHGHGVKDPEG